jgi:4-hydroxy 2-oxovalerate aldolase
MVPPAKVAEQAKLFASYGADYINVADSAGAMLPDDVRARIAAVREAVSIPVGFHAHNNLALAMGNTLAAIDAGATVVDATLRGFGGGSGNAQLEVLVAVLDRASYATGIDLYKVMDVAAACVDPVMLRPQIISNDALAIGYAGAYSTFLLHARRAAEKFGVDARDILIEMGRRRTVGGQEDLIIEVALELAKAKQGK